MLFRSESWTIKKAKSQRIDAFELWCWRGLLRVSWTARKSNQSILKEISPEYLLEGLMLKLKLQYFGHLRQSIGSLEKTLMTEDEMVGRHHQLNEHEFEQALGDGEGQGSLERCSLISQNRQTQNFQICLELTSNLISCYLLTTSC